MIRPARAALAATLLVLALGCGCDKMAAQQESVEPQEAAYAEGEGTMISPQARRKLLGIAREAVAAAVGSERPPATPVDDPELQGKQGAFVTLKTHGQLRGCIGRFVSNEPLWKTVREVAVDSATQDPRFRHMRLRPEDMVALEIEISVLSPMQRIDNPLDIELGVHGIYIRRGSNAGTFLPQVATEQGWTKEEFLSYCCAHKAGLPPDAWKDPDTAVLVYTAEIIEEGEQQ